MCKQVILTSLRMVGVERVFLIYWEPILSGVCVRCVNIMCYEGAGYVCVYTLCLWGWCACVCILYVCMLCLCVCAWCIALVAYCVGAMRHAILHAITC